MLQLTDIFLVSGNIIDGSVGNFAGNIVGKSYTWEKPSDGVELHDMKAGGGNCEAYSGCMPFFLPPGISKTTSRKTTTKKTTTKATSKRTTTTTEGDVDTLTDTLTDTVTMLQSAITTVTNTATLSQDTTTTTLVEQVGVVTDTVTLIQNEVTMTVEQEPRTVEIIIDHEPSTITEGGQTIVFPGQNRTVTQEPGAEVTTEVYTTTITESGSTFLSLVTTTRALPGGGGVVTLIGPGNVIQTTVASTEFAPVTVTETIMEWYPRKHYHHGSDEPCYEDDEEEERDEEEEDEDEDCDEDEDRYEDHKDRYQNE